MKRIYLCSPYSDPDPQVRRLRWQKVCQILGELKRAHPDILFFSPIAHSYPLVIYGGLPDTLEFWWPLNKTWIDWATHLWVADMIGANESKGVRKEVLYAFETDKPMVWL